MGHILKFHEFMLRESEGSLAPANRPAVGGGAHDSEKRVNVRVRYAKGSYDPAVVNERLKSVGAIEVSKSNIESGETIELNIDFPSQAKFEEFSGMHETAMVSEGKVEFIAESDSSSELIVRFAEALDNVLSKFPVSKFKDSTAKEWMTSVHKKITAIIDESEGVASDPTMESTVNEYDGHAPAQKVHKLKFYMGGDMDKKPFVELLRKVVQEGDKEAFDKIQGEVDEIES
jgi:hypothetical protein